MKTLNLFRFSVMVLSLSFIVASCSKIDDTPMKMAAPSAPSDNLSQIIDYGSVAGAKGDVRHMHAVLFDAGSLVNASSGAVVENASEINLAFYTDMDNIIPAGTYEFSKDPVKASFTFGDGFVLANMSGDSGEQLNLMPTGGKIYVDMVGETYEFTFDVDLSDGYRLQGTLSSVLDYFDAI